MVKKAYDTKEEADKSCYQEKGCAKDITNTK